LVGVGACRSCLPYDIMWKIFGGVSGVLAVGWGVLGLLGCKLGWESIECLYRMFVNQTLLFDIGVYWERSWNLFKMIGGTCNFEI